MRRTLLRILRATHLIQFADRTLALRAVSKQARANDAYRATHPERVFPDPALVFETIGEASLEVFDTGGAIIARLIADHLLQTGLPRAPRILDWGAGAGRLLVQLPALLNAPDARYFGCDPNPRAVAHVQRLGSGILNPTDRGEWTLQSLESDLGRKRDAKLIAGGLDGVPDDFFSDRPEL